MESDPPEKKKKKKNRFSLFRRRPSKTSMSAAESARKYDEKRNSGTGGATAGGVAQVVASHLQTIPASPGGQSHLIPESLPGEVHFRDSPGGNVSVVTNGTGMPQSQYGYSTPEKPGKKAGGRAQQQQQQPAALLPTMAGDETTVGDGSSLLLPPAMAPSPRGVTASKDKKTCEKIGHGSFWSRSPQFRKLSDWAFDLVDADESGYVDKKELYSGLLLIHLNLASYMGPAACRPATREYVETIFDKMDDDSSGTLDRDEFADVMSVLCGQVMTRVVLQWSMTLMIVPLLAQYVLDGILLANRTAWDFWSGVGYIELAWDQVVEVSSDRIPDALKSGWEMACRYWTMIPESLLEALPLTVLSCILGGIAVPYMLFRIDDFFHGMADKTKEKKKKALKTV